MIALSSSQVPKAIHLNKKAFLLLVMLCLPAYSYAELTEFQVVELGMADPQIKAKWQAQRERAKGELLSEGRWDNPSIEYSQESVDTPGGANEETTLWLRQNINIAGVNRLERKAAKKDSMLRQNNSP